LELLERPDVLSLPARPPAELPALMRHCDVGLVPFLVNDHTRASLPLKLWEYVAAGLPVVATDLPNLKTAAATGAVSLAREPDGFASLARELAREPEDARPRRSALARPHDWALRMDDLCSAVARALDSQPRDPRVRLAGPSSPNPPGTSPDFPAAKPPARRGPSGNQR
jgi:glycosyltransferase involved in cell wall biosynthesis